MKQLTDSLRATANKLDWATLQYITTLSENSHLADKSLERARHSAAVELEVIVADLRKSWVLDSEAADESK